MNENWNKQRQFRKPAMMLAGQQKNKKSIRRNKMGQIPENLESVTVEWLLTLVQHDKEMDGEDITHIAHRQVGDGIGQSGEFSRVTAATASGLTKNYFLKLRAPLDGMHQVALHYRMYEKEIKFYTELAGQMSARTPQIFYSEFDKENEKIVLLMEFMDGWHSPDQIVGATDRQIRSAIKALAKISAPLWGKTSTIEWLPTYADGYLRETQHDIQACAPIFAERFMSALPIARKDFDRVISGWPVIMDKLCEAPLTFTHDDFRVENLFFSADDSEVAVIDWQLIAAIRPSWDFAYLIGTNIQTEIRRANQQDYIDLYLAELAEHGVNYAEADLREDMKWTLLGNASIPVIGGANFVISNARSFELFQQMSVRLFETVLDFDALSVLN